MSLKLLLILGWAVICSASGWLVLAIVVLAIGPDLIAGDPATKHAASVQVIFAVLFWLLLQSPWMLWVRLKGAPSRWMIIGGLATVAAIYALLDYSLGGPFTGGIPSATSHLPQS